MTYRSKDLLTSWVHDFAAQHPAAPPIAVLLQDGSEGADTGLVVVRIANATVDVYVEPETPDGSRWRTTLTRPTDDLDLTVEQLASLAEELRLAAVLCAYLAERSAGRRSRIRPDASSALAPA